MDKSSVNISKQNVIRVRSLIWLIEGSGLVYNRLEMAPRNPPSPYFWCDRASRALLNIGKDWGRNVFRFHESFHMPACITSQDDASPGTAMIAPVSEAGFYAPLQIRVLPNTLILQVNFPAVFDDRKIDFRP